MNIRGAINTISNVVLFLVTCALSGTGLLLEMRLDDEDGPARILGMNADNWGEIHFAIALTFIGLAAIHGVLHWSWIKAQLRQHRLAVLSVLAVGALLVSSILTLPVVHYGNQSERGEQEEVGDHDE